MDGLFRLLEQVAGPGSRVVFDYIKESVLTGDEDVPGARQALASVRRAGEDWCFALAPDQVPCFVESYGMQLLDHQDARDLETTYFTDAAGNRVGQVNQTHAIAVAQVDGAGP